MTVSPDAEPDTCSARPTVGTAAGTGARRVFENRRIWQMSAESFTRAVELLAAAEDPFGPEMIVGITRGGAPLAAALADRLDVPRTLVGARHNSSDRIAVQGTGDVEVDLHSLPRGTVTPGARVLLVDDICGTGATLNTVAAALQPLLDPGGVRAAVLCRNAGARDTAPDSWVWDVRDWTLFPWEQPPDDTTVPIESLPVPTQVRHP